MKSDNERDSFHSFISNEFGKKFAKTLEHTKVMITKPDVDGSINVVVINKGLDDIHVNAEKSVITYRHSNDMLLKTTKNKNFKKKNSIISHSTLVLKQVFGQFPFFIQLANYTTSFFLFLRDEKKKNRNQFLLESVGR